MSRRNVVAAGALLVLATGCEIPHGGASKVVLPEPESAGAQVLKENCSSCHAAPSPSVHTAKEWPNVIYRMLEHRRMRSFGPIAPADQEQLLDYLQRHAKS